MALFWTAVATVLLALGSDALPQAPKSCASRYPLAKHSIPLYRSTVPAFGNFEADITIGSQTVRTVLDTGSSDPWYMEQGVQCQNSSNLKPIPSNLCGFKGTRLRPSPSFQPNDKHFNLTYGSGESVIATAGFDHIRFGGIEIPQQEIGLAKTASFNYDGNATGILGLA